MDTVSLTPLFNVADHAVYLLLAGVGAWALASGALWLNRHAAFLNAQTRSEIVSNTQKLVAAGISFAMNNLERYEGEHSTVAVKGWIASTAAQYAVNHADSLLKDATGLNADALAEKALAQLPPIEIDRPGAILVSGQVIDIGKPSGVAAAKEPAVTAALNERELAQQS